MITEGVKKGDLEYLVLPTISIDEYQSKIIKDAIVVALFVIEEDAAYDLSGLIEHGPVDVLDTEVSPAPNENGYYLLFIEMDRNKEFPEQLLKIIKNISPIVDIKNSTWKMKPYHVKEFIDLNLENLNKYVRLEELNELKTVEEELYSFFKNSLLEDVKLNENILELHKPKTKQKFSINGFYNYEELEEFMKENTIKLDETSIAMCSRIEKYLGENWNVHMAGEFFVIDGGQNLYLVVEKV